MKSFNTTGPCIPAEHYMLPALQRVKEALKLVADRKYFILHAPRQSGKTTSLLALRDELNRKGEAYAVYCSLEEAGEIQDPVQGVLAVARILKRELRVALTAADVYGIPLEESPETAIRSLLSEVCAKLDRPLVLLLDEIDCLVDVPLLSLLRQLRNGYIQRATAPFPASVALVGMRNLRDYRIRLRPEQHSLGTGSPFNIVAKYLTLDTFTQEEVAALYRQHTEATGQIFEEAAVERAFYWTNGQPWLVNAIARECVEEICQNDYTRPVTAAMVDEAVHTIVRRRDVLFPSIYRLLAEARVMRILAPLITGSDLPAGDLQAVDDLSYVLDLGLLRRDERTGIIRFANRLYEEVIIRRLTPPFYEAAVRLFPGKPMT